MNAMQELITDQIEDYKKQLKSHENKIIKKAKANEDYSLELEKAKMKKIQIEQACLMFEQYK